MAGGDPLPESGAALVANLPIDWRVVNADLQADLDVLHHQLSSRSISISAAEESFVTITVSTLSRSNLLKEKRPGINPRGLHRLSSIQKTARNLAMTKNSLRGSISTNPRPFLNAVRAHNKVAKVAADAANHRSTLQQERKYRQNPFEFARSILQSKKNQPPEFSAQSAHQFLRTSFSKEPCTYAGLPDWIHSVMPTPLIRKPFDMSPITPSQVKRALRKCSSKSSSGCNGISYYHLKHLPTTHHFLATLFSRILLDEHSCPPSWCVGKITLVHKSGPPSEPSSFRPIALTSTVGKLFNRIIASRLEHFVLANNIIDPSTQKGFLSGIPGVIEHIFTTSAILSNAKTNGLPLYMTFLDLSNAFGSISHQLIADMLKHICIPTPVISYISNAYSQLKGFASSPNWTTNVFPIERGVFQGDTLSPMIFLIAFNPIVELANMDKASGFSFRYPVPSSAGLPPVNAHIYVEWNEPSSDEPPGWYRCSVTEYSPAGLSTVLYANGSTETVDLRTVQWHLATGNSRHFLSKDSTPPTAKVPKVRAKLQDIKFFTTRPHRAKAYCDDLSLNIDQS